MGLFVDAHIEIYKLQRTHMLNRIYFRDILFFLEFLIFSVIFIFLKEHSNGIETLSVAVVVVILPAAADAYIQ